MSRVAAIVMRKTMTAVASEAEHCLLMMSVADPSGVIPSFARELSPVCCRRGDERGETDATQRLQQGGDPERRVEGDERDEHGAQGEHDAAENGDLASPEPICRHTGGRFEYECGKGSGEQHDAGFEGRVTGTVNGA